MRQRKLGRDSSFEVNVLPTLDILSVLICFLLLTAVWVQMGYIPSKQVIESSASNSSSNGIKSVELEVLFESNLVRFNVKGADRTAQNQRYLSQQIRTRDLNEKSSQLIASLAQQFPDLKMAKIYPGSGTQYGQVVQLMSELRKNKILDLGVASTGG